MKSDSIFGLLTVGGLAAIIGIGTVQQKRIARLEDGQAELLRQVKSIGAGAAPARAAAPAVRAPDPMPSEPISIAGAASRGNERAKLVMVEFSDFECPFCGRYVRDTYPQLQREYVDAGKVRYVFRQYPIESLHPRAFKAAEAAECAREQGKFWDMHDRLFANQQALTEPDLLKYAKAIGLNQAGFKQCVTGPAAARIRQDLTDGSKAGITGTPWFFLGAIEGDGKIRVKRVLSGAEPYATFKTTIDQLLTSPNTK